LSAAAGTADLVNIAVVLGFDAAVLYFLGIKALAYLLVGVLAGGGLHPMAGHLIAEHYMFLKVPLRITEAASGSCMHVCQPLTLLEALTQHDLTVGLPQQQCLLPACPVGVHYLRVLTSQVGFC
jgi:hypothetical protein